jgi:hypothetical protein
VKRGTYLLRRDKGEDAHSGIGISPNSLLAFRQRRTWERGRLPFVGLQQEQLVDRESMSAAAAAAVP